MRHRVQWCAKSPMLLGQVVMRPKSTNHYYGQRLASQADSSIIVGAPSRSMCVAPPLLCRTPEDASRLLRSLEYRYDTKIGTQLEAKILRPMAYNRRLAKPLLIITVTDGEPSDKPMDKIFSVILDCVQQMTRAGYGPHAVAFQFAQVRVNLRLWGERGRGAVPVPAAYHSDQW